jgi:hypothetical protein
MLWLLTAVEQFGEPFVQGMAMVPAVTSLNMQVLAG